MLSQITDYDNKMLKGWITRIHLLYSYLNKNTRVSFTLNTLPKTYFLLFVIFSENMFIIQVRNQKWNLHSLFSFCTYWSLLFLLVFVIPIATVLLSINLHDFFIYFFFIFIATISTEQSFEMTCFNTDQNSMTTKGNATP